MAKCCYRINCGHIRNIVDIQIWPVHGVDVLVLNQTTHVDVVQVVDIRV